MTKCYTFYSYKGGSGRSTTAANTIPHLIKDLKASPKAPILIIDADIESAGLTYFFHCEKKFCQVLQNSLHTTNLFAKFDAFSNEYEKKHICAPEKSKEFSISMGKAVIIKRLHSICVEKRINDFGSEEGIRSLVGDIVLREGELAIFNQIVEIINKELVGENLDKKEDEEVFYKFQNELMNLLFSLSEIQNGNSPNKPALKQKLVRDFLPTDSFVDISEQYNCEKGTVRFLGVDLEYKGERPKSSKLTEILGDIIDLCDEFNYSAVVFDSGAGVQSTAHALNHVSDVLVYCMRPTLQFINGTLVQLSSYRETLVKAKNRRSEISGVDGDKPIVILLPTAVPKASSNPGFAKQSFDKIGKIVNAFSDIVDSAFCSPETALNEIESFKWEERILLEEAGKDDEKQAFGVYRKLSRRLTEISAED